jgi:hypothetical protein
LEVAVRRSLPLLTPVYASALLLSCGEQPAHFEPTGNTLASRTSNNPEGPGAFVVAFPEASFVDADPAPAPGLTVHPGRHVC